MKVAFHTLGCKVNQYETEAMAAMFREHGHIVVDEKEFADAYIINTCTVTAIADKKSRQYIRRMKKINPDSVVAVTGCYAQIKPEELASVKGVDVVTGTNEKKTIIGLVENAFNDKRFPCSIRVHPYEELGDYIELGQVASTESRTRANIKIQEGCNRFCSYCVIPYARGPIRSRDLDAIVKEAKALIEAGYKEIVLTGINTAQYGMEGIDLYGTKMPDEIFGIEKVIAAVNELEGDFRIRLSSLEPAVVNSQYVKRLFKYDKLCHHLHMSAQSGSDNVLAAMNRPYNINMYYDLVNTLFDFDPCYGVSTDIIVGFPGEREADFRESMNLVEECCFCKTHIFKYSRRPMTKAAEFKEQVSPQVKNERSDRLRQLAKKSARGFFEINLAAASEGRTESVLIEEKTEDGKYLTGYTGNYIRTYIEINQNKDEKELLNAFVDVKLTELFRDGMKAVIFAK